MTARNRLERGRMIIIGGERRSQQSSVFVRGIRIQLFTCVNYF